jgi:plastocyanin
MSRKLRSATLGLALLVAACGSQKPGSQAVKVSFVPQVVDFLDDVGYSPSLVLDKEGNPYLSYLGFTHVLTAKEKKEGVIPPLRPVTAPRLPAVLVATQIKGLWVRGAAAQSSDQATGPKVPIERSDQTATAVDPTGVQHVVWTERGGLFYANDEGGEFPDEATKVAGGATGPSIAVDPSGTAWIAFYTGSAVEAATVSGDKVAVEKVASVGTCRNCPPLRTAIQAGAGGPVIAYLDPTTKAAMLATRSGKGWSARRAGGLGGGGFGLAMATDDRGTPYLSYFGSDGSVMSVAGEGQRTERVGALSTGNSTRGLTGGTTIAVTKDGTQYVAWADPKEGVKLARSSGGGDFSIVSTEGTEAGTSPALAATPDGKAVLAWFEAKSQDLMLGTYPESEVGLLALPSPSATPATPSAAPGGACAPDDVGITAPPGAATTGFENTNVGAPGGKPFGICFDNKDSTIHNVAIFKSESDASAGGKALFTGEVVQGPTQVEYTVDSLQPGGYFFRCDVHPGTMTGTLTVK